MESTFWFGALAAFSLIALYWVGFGLVFLVVAAIVAPGLLIPVGAILAVIGAFYIRSRKENTRITRKAQRGD